MKLSEFLEELAYGELSDLSMVSNGQIKPEMLPKVVIKINDVIQSLYSKYVIKTVNIDLDTTIKSFSYTISGDNIVQIVYIHPNLVDEAEIYRNNDQLSIKSKTITFIKHPVANSFHITYQWRPTKLKISPATPRFEDQLVELDYALVPLVKLLVASSIFGNMNGELHKKTGVELFNQAQILQNDLELTGILNIAVEFKDNRFKVNGFT